MNKIFISILLACSLLLSGCDNNKNKTSKSSSGEQTEKAPETEKDDDSYPIHG